MKTKSVTIIALLCCLLASIQLLAQDKFFTATSNDEAYNWPMLGNGHLQTIVGPACFHSGKVLQVESVNRTSLWAGRRHDDPARSNTWIPRFDKDVPIGSTRPLVRCGRVH